MGLVPYIVWGLSVFLGGYLWRILDPVVETILQEQGISTMSLTFANWFWNFGVLFLIVVAPTVWVVRRYQSSEARI